MCMDKLAPQLDLTFGHLERSNTSLSIDIALYLILHIMVKFNEILLFT